MSHPSSSRIWKFSLQVFRLFVISTFGRWLFWWARLSWIFFVGIPDASKWQQKKTTRFTRSFPTKTLQSVHLQTPKPPCRLLLELCHGFRSHIGLGSASPRSSTENFGCKAPGWRFLVALNKSPWWIWRWFLLTKHFFVPRMFFFRNSQKLFTNFLVGVFSVVVLLGQLQMYFTQGNPWSITSDGIVRERFFAIENSTWSQESWRSRISQYFRIQAIFLDDASRTTIVNFLFSLGIGCNSSKTGTYVLNDGWLAPRTAHHVDHFRKIPPTTKDLPPKKVANERFHYDHLL